MKADPQRMVIDICQRRSRLSGLPPVVELSKAW